ncbi:MAG: trigger factor [Candidatus Porifericomitaceae bacterium WSBS_2022_MAG_OTU9]
MAIQRELEQEGPLGRKLTIHIDADDMRKARADCLRDIGNKVQLPGFRRGKVTASVLERKYGQQAAKEATENMVQSSLSAALREEQLNPVGMPQVKLIDGQQQDGLSYCASFDVFPQLQLCPAKELEVQQPSCEITDEDMEIAMQNLQQHHLNQTLVTREARMGDVVECTMVLIMANGEAAKPQRQHITLTDKVEKSVLDFLKGCESGKSGTVDVAGLHKDSTEKMPLQITVEGVYETSLPELDEDFFAKMGVASMDVLRSEMRRTLENEARHLETKVLWKRVCDALCKHHAKMDLPQKLVQQESERLQQSGMDQKQASVAAADAIREHLLVELYVQKNELEPSPREVRKLVERAASGHDNPKAYVDWHYKDGRRLQNYRWAALQNRMLTHISQQGGFAKQSMSFAELSAAAA